MEKIPHAIDAVSKIWVKEKFYRPGKNFHGKDYYLVNNVRRKLFAKIKKF